MFKKTWNAAIISERTCSLEFLYALYFSLASNVIKMVSKKSLNSGPNNLFIPDCKYYYIL